MPLRLWSGANYFDTRMTIEGRFNAPGVGRVRFEVEQGPKHPWNGVVGMNAGAGERLDFSFEFGFNFDDVRIFMLGATVRF